MLAEEVGELRSLDDGGADARHLVGREGHADARAADEDAPLGLASRHVARHLVGEVGVVAAVGGGGTKVHHLVAKERKVLHHPRLLVEPGVV